MYASGYSKAKKLEYERIRRAKNRVEKKEAQVLKPWLRKKYTVIYQEFMNYYATLQKAYPTVKNLAVTREFKKFMGMYYKKLIFFVIFFVF
jgi:trans-aconitate methyltransferase